MFGHILRQSCINTCRSTFFSTASVALATGSITAINQAENRYRQWKKKDAMEQTNFPYYIRAMNHT
ncbi:hypothetical protein [Legionella spiritensis]|uniref:Uncharacterized protein n=1 Tax=Legionella spiritensis TaxID=452 RepID=A0A0W0Z4H1_LEGSP|nr:hypothetical protein [Legionella spiritensis]KTD64048.1 hypothetical protein Lspi_1567 [Legionella spiritensis]SNV37412.1 Uncharacterised protein [Legionella spiritensis]